MEGLHMNGFDSFLRPEVIWCLIALFFVFAEFFIPGLVIVFFAIGAFFAAAAQWYYGDLSINVQLTIFLVSSVLSLAVLRRFASQVFLGRKEGEPDPMKNIDSFVGDEAIAAETFNPGERGRVEFHGTTWSAVSQVPVEKGQVLSITGQENLVLYVGPKHS
jgi:membrane protein implicated in regulation of membrane protease activity